MPTLSQSISTNLSPLGDNELLNYVTSLATKLPEVPKYANLTPAVADAQLTIKAFGEAVATASTGSQADRLTRDNLRLQIEAIVREWSEGATSATPGDVVQWAKAGFRLTKGETSPRTAPAAPSRFAVADGPARGSVVMSQNAQKGTKVYVYEYALVPAEGQAPQWHYCLGNKGTCTVSGLLSGRQYMFRCAAWNGTGETAYSVIETRYVQ